MKKIIFILTCLSTLGGHLVAQNPKWFKKAAKAQISIVTMNEKGDMLQSGSGFFIMLVSPSFEVWQPVSSSPAAQARAAAAVHLRISLTNLSPFVKRRQR